MSDEMDIIEELSLIDPSYASETDGSSYCFFCHAFLEIKEPHAPGCLWDRAQAISKNSKIGKSFRIEHDGFEGQVIGAYERIDGYKGVVMQQDGTRIVHVYGEKWLKPETPCERCKGTGELLNPNWGQDHETTRSIPCPVCK